MSRKNHQVNIIIATPNMNTSKKPIIIGTNPHVPVRLLASQRSQTRSVHTAVVDLFGDEVNGPKNTV